MANPAIFEDYFRRADLDRDGRISGAEAVAFFQGANLPKVTLARIWQFADQSQGRYLSRIEFYNALKLVTVAQTGRELTPEIVRAALAGPAAAQIPAPRINTANLQAPPNYAPRPGLTPQTGSASFPEQFSPGSVAPPRQWSSQPASAGANNSGHPPAAVPRPGSSSGQRAPGGFSSDTWPSIRQAPGSSAPPQVPATSPPPAPSYQAGQSFSTQPRKEGSDNFFSGVGVSRGSSSTFTSNALVDAFGGDPFAATPKSAAPAPPPQVSGPTLSQGLSDMGDAGFRAEPAGAAHIPPSASSRDAGKHVQQPGPHVRPGLPTPAAGMGSGGGAPWPRMTPSDTQRYTRVFSEVDTDRDGKITGDQARDLFLGWRLPRDVLKQVWDLSDQDGDSELSLREFCTALYLMERYREGRPLPPVLPSGLFADDRQPEVYGPPGPVRMESGSMSFANNPASYNAPNWQQHPGALQPTGSGMPPNPRQMQSQPSDRPTSAHGPTLGGATSDPVQPAQYISKAPGLETHLVNQLARDEQDILKSRHKDAEEADKKAYDLDKEIMDYREKAEFYRSKLQEIILFKSRCENRLGEITERAAADKREMDSLAKKYDERFKAAGDANSRLQAEEAAFRDIQEKKIELYNAIAKMEQGGDANGLMQSKADRISSDLDALKKALNERARRLGLNVKATAPTEQEFGWQPGLQEKAAEWDEDWDKFDDEGFVTVQDFMDDATAGNFPTSASWDGTRPSLDDGDFSSSPKKLGPTVEIPKETSSVSGQMASNHASPRAESEESGRSGLESPSQDVSTSSSQAVGKSSKDRPANNAGASHRYAHLLESQEDVFNGPTAYSSTTNSDTFGDGGVSWSAAFSHDDEVDSGVRASWGLQSNPPSTQASLDVAGSRTSRFGKTGLSSQGFGDSLDLGSMHVSSPGRGTDVFSPTESQRGNGNSRDFEGNDRFGSPGLSKDFDRSPKFFGNHNAQAGHALFDSPRKAAAGEDVSFKRFDSFSSPRNNPASPGNGEHRHENSFFAAIGTDHNDRSYARFDSFSSAKGDVGHGKPPVYGSFDDGDDLFAGAGPFSATGGQDKKTSDHGWSAF